MDQQATRAIDDLATRFAEEGDSSGAFDQLAVFVRALLRSRRLSKVLAAPGVPSNAKRTLIADVTNNALGSLALDAASLLSEQGSRSSSFQDTVVESFAQLSFAIAERQGRLETVERNLHDLSVIVTEDQQLRDAITTPAVVDAAKEALLEDLLQGKVDDLSIVLIRTLVAVDHGRGVDRLAERLSRAAAKRRNKVVADVETAIELDDARRLQLREKLSEVIGMPVEPRFSVDPSIVGSVIVRIGDEVIDGSVRHRLAQARLTVVGGS